jgi:hypothetical protein
MRNGARTSFAFIHCRIGFDRQLKMHRRQSDSNPTAEFRSNLLLHTVSTKYYSVHRVIDHLGLLVLVDSK